MEVRVQAAQKRPLLDEAISWLVGVLGLIYAGWVIWLFWGWFVVPLGVRPISPLHGIGIDIIVSFLTRGSSSGKPPRLVQAFLETTFLLGVAWLVHLGMR